MPPCLELTFQAETALAQIEGMARHGPLDVRVRRAVQLRARDACEYCFRPTDSSFTIDHVVPQALWQRYADGEFDSFLGTEWTATARDHVSNYAWACMWCNRKKLNNICGAAPGPKRATAARLFNPRRDCWGDHFYFLPGYVLIQPLDAIGSATLDILQFNDTRADGPLQARFMDVLVDKYPPAFALRWTVTGEPVGWP